MEEVTHSKSGGRVPPQDVETERSLLGAIMISDGVMVNVSTILKPEDFYDKRHQIIYGAMMNLWDAHRPIDLVTITNELKTQKKLNDVGKATYLAELSAKLSDYPDKTAAYAGTNPGVLAHDAALHCPASLPVPFDTHHSFFAIRLASISDQHHTVLPSSEFQPEHLCIPSCWE